ncbi:MAG: SIMPL domain-containing protein [Acidimicrobiia bacterium]
MNRTTRRNAIALIGGAALLLAACGSAPGEITVNTSNELRTGISVSGVGEVTGTPDTLQLDLGVSALADTVDQAAATAAERAQAVIAALTSNGVAEEDITTTDYSIFPEYDYSNNTERIVGYRVNNTVRAKLHDIDGAGTVIDAVTAAGGDETRVNGLNFSIEDDAELIADAREAAWNDALAKATQLAELSGRELGAATSIVEIVSNPPIPFPYARDMAGGAETAETPIEPGTSTVTIDLQVEFGFEG